jgi:amino acid transporter
MSEKVELNKTLGLTGVTMNAMALIAPGAFLWLTFQMQASQTNSAGQTTAMDIFPGLVIALVLAFLTAISYAKLSELYPEAGTGSSYYFAEHAFMNESSKLSTFSRISKYIVGWFSHLYYWIYPGVMVAMMATLITYILSQFGINVPIIGQVLIAIVFAALTGAVAYRGINGSTLSSIIINVIQIVTLVFVTVLAIIYRITNPQHVQFVHKSFTSIIMPHNFSNVLFQATISILLLVGFESATALAGEAKSSKHISRGVILSLVLQGLIFYVFEYVGASAWLNTGYKVTDSSGKIQTGIAAAAASSAPIGDMVKILGDSLLNNSGFVLMIIVAVSVAIAVFGSTLACMNTGVRVTYAMAKDEEVPSVLGALHHKHATPHNAVWIITIVSAVVGAIGVVSVTNLTAVTLVSNIGTFILYGMTNLISLVAYMHHSKRNIFTHMIVPILGFAANIAMLLAVLYLGILGGGATQTASVESIIVTIIWLVIGGIYLSFNSKKLQRPIIVVKQ